MEHAAVLAAMGPLQAGSSEALHQALTHHGNTYQTEHLNEWCPIKISQNENGIYSIPPIRYVCGT